MRPDGFPVVAVQRILDEVGDNSKIAFCRISDAMLGEHSAAEFPHRKRFLRLAQNIECDVSGGLGIGRRGTGGDLVIFGIRHSTPDKCTLVEPFSANCFFLARV